MKRFVWIFLLIFLSACASRPAGPDGRPGSSDSETGPSAGETSPASVVFTDDLGREVTVESPRRVTALIGSFADVWCLAGGKDLLVAAAGDSWTSFDLGLDESVVDLGGVKEPNLELLLSAQPDFILASSNTDADVELLDTFEQVGLTVAYFDIQHFDDYLHMLDVCTQLTGCRENYDRYGLQVRAQVEQAKVRQTGEAPTVICMRSTGSSCKVKGSVDFLLGEMLADLGCVNLADGDDALLEDLSLEAILAADPDWIFVVLQGSDPTNAMETLEQTLLSNPAWAGLTAVREGRFYTLEHELYNLKPNARWGEAYEKLADILYGPA